MSTKCPFCGEYFVTYFQDKEIENMLNLNLETNNILIGLKSQIKTMVNDMKNNQVNNKLEEIKNIIIILDSVLKNLNNNIDNLRNIDNIIKQNNKKPLSNSQRHHIKGSNSWDKFVAECLFNKKYEDNDDIKIYNNILTKAALVGNNGAYWAYSSNFIMSPFQYEKIKAFFNKESNCDIQTLTIDDKDFEIINYKPGISLDLKEKNNEGKEGGTIAKINKGYIFGFFNSNVNYKLNGILNSQNMKLCNKVIIELANNIKSQGY